MRRGLLHRNKAQAAIELAVFGAIVIFVVGMIVRTAVSNSYTMNQNLKAMRYAMLKSLQTSSSGSTSRNSASVLYIEDRLSPDFSKYGSLDRTPYFAQGSGTFTNLLFYSVDPDEVEQNLPTTDIYINGVHLPLTTAGLREIVHQPPVLKDQWDEIQKHNRQQISYIDVLVDYGIYDRYERFYDGDATVPDPRGDGTHRYHGWDFKCASEEIDNPAAPGTKIKRYYGCQLYYTLIPNGRAGWCITDGCNNDGSPLNLDERFDLNRNDDFSDDPKDNTRTKVPRKDMAWQWRAVKGLFSVSEMNGRASAANSRYPSFDINNDRKEETLYTAIVPGAGSGVVKDIIMGETALDFTAGDLDLSRDDSDEGQVGLQSDTAIYTRPRTGGTGTYLEIRNGKLFDAGSNTVVRSLNKRDTVDIIERRIRLSNNTGRFCRASYECQGGVDASGNCPSGVIQLVTSPPGECIAGLAKVNGVCPAGDNPVEACAASDTSTTTIPGNPTIANDCFKEENVAKTCMDVSTNIIYVRSRLMDQQGHKWTTDVSGLSQDTKKQGTQSWGELGVK